MQIKNLTVENLNNVLDGTINDISKQCDKKLGNRETKDINVQYENNNIDKFFVKNNNLIKNHGLHWITAALFIVADMVGSGIVALPIAVVRSSFIELGVSLILLLAILSTATSIFLGKAWVILLRRYPIYRIHCRKPFAEMGYRALGPKMKTIVSVCLTVTQFGASTAFLLLIAQSINNFFFVVVNVNIGLCWMIFIISFLLFPITLFKSPQDFWHVVVLGMLSTGVAVVLICIGALLDYKCANEVQMPKFQVSNFLIAIGTIMFAYGGHSALPTIQHDMRKPHEFKKSSYLAFSIITGMNLIVVLFGTLIYGDSMRQVVILSIQEIKIQQAINIMIVAHCLLTFTLIINPLNQEIEEYFNIPQRFGVRRVIVRVTIISGAAFVAASIPTLDLILSLIGGLAFTLISIVFPCLFYLYLSAQESKFINLKQNFDFSEDYLPISFFEVLKRTKPIVLIVCFTISVIGFISGLVATITAIGTIASKLYFSKKSLMDRPCYLNMFYDDAKINSNLLNSVTNCCGKYQNISLLNNNCMDPDLNYYKKGIF